MSKKLTSTVSVLFSITLIAVFFQNCSQEPFDEGSAYGLSSTSVDTPITSGLNVTLSEKSSLTSPITEGSPVTLQTNAEVAGVGIKYDWYVRSVLGAPVLVGTTIGPEYSFNMSSAFTGYMYVRVTFPDQSSKESAWFPLAMQQAVTLSAPTISSEIPAASQFNQSVGDSLSFSVSALGNPAPAYVWQRQTLSGWQDMNQNAASLNLSNLTLADGGGYRLKIVNSQGTIYSKVFSVSVTQTYQQLMVTSAPQNQTVNSGQNANFSIGVSQGSGNYSYNWIKVGSSNTMSSSNQLSLTSLAVADSGTYRVTVSDSAANMSVTRDVNLVVNPAPQPSVLSLVSLSTNPSNGELLFSISAFSGYDSTSQFCFQIDYGNIGAFSNQNCITYYYENGDLNVTVKDGQAPYTYKYIRTHKYAYNSALRRIALTPISEQVVANKQSISTSDSFTVVPKFDYQNTGDIYQGWGQYRVEVTDSTGRRITAGTRVLKYCAQNYQTNAVTCY